MTDRRLLDLFYSWSLIRIDTRQGLKTIEAKPEDDICDERIRDDCVANRIYSHMHYTTVLHTHSSTWKKVEPLLSRNQLRHVTWQPGLRVTHLCCNSTVNTWRDLSINHLLHRKPCYNFSSVISTNWIKLIILKVTLSFSCLTYKAAMRRRTASF